MELEALASNFPECELRLSKTVERVEVAIAEPSELRVDLSGTLSKATVECVLDALVGQGMLEAGLLHTAKLRHGVRIATAAALQDGLGGAALLTQRFEALSAESDYVLVSDTAPEGSLYEGFRLANGDFEARIGLSSSAAAAEAASWLLRAVGTSRDQALARVKASAREKTLTVHLPDAGPALALALRREVLEAFRIPSASMYPTLLLGDHLMVLKAAADRPAERGDLVVFNSPHEQSQLFVKRVVGLPGDHVQLEGYTLRVNGVALDTALDTPNFVVPGTDEAPAELWREALGSHHYRVMRTTSPSTLEPLDVRVPKDSVFLLGDNRDNSFDSRQFGSVPLAQVKGRVVLVWASFWAGAPRWERFGVEPN